MPEPNPEQTAALSSFMFYSFLDPIIWYAYRVPHLKHEELPPLADYDYIKNLVKRSYPVSPPIHLMTHLHKLTCGDSTSILSTERRGDICSGA